MSTNSLDIDALLERPHDYGKLYDSEARWRDKQHFLQSKGYMLRPRLRPNWTPSWLRSGKHPIECEDGISLPARGNLVDATRMSDNKLVYIKRVRSGDQESTIAYLLSSDRFRMDSRNHSVPILDMFVDDEDPGISYMVMPFLRYFNSPDFQTVGEIIDFVDQILEGLAFMHEHGVAHRDCSMPNILMDGERMYPQGFHPVHSMVLPDGETWARPYTRSQVGVRYYFVDYGISSYFPPDQPRGFVTGNLGRDQDVPELSKTVPYDPFPVDIFTIGHVIRDELYQKYSNVEFLHEIIVTAMQPDPRRRPAAAELLRLWDARRRRISSLHRSWRLRGRTESAVEGAARDCFSLVYSAFSFAGTFVRK
ncbi:hypothetical protein PENSPDRAFT_609714 [Peniophora sp. CONT]|nr:hypothetical protein PENSPDRAFT_609714 [Peniophora sp. CONT]